MKKLINIRSYLKIMADFKEKDRMQRIEFVEYWVTYMKNHSDAEWSRQQNVIINSVLKTTMQLSRREYLFVKNELCFV